MKLKMSWRAAVIFSTMLAGIALIGAGCSISGSRTSAGPSTALKKGVAATEPARVSGAQLWAQNCGHCHNIRSPGMYSNDQWEVILFHMRVRANLTAEEHKQILAFLKSAR